MASNCASSAKNSVLINQLDIEKEASQYCLNKSVNYLYLTYLSSLYSDICDLKFDEYLAKQGV